MTVLSADLARGVSFKIGLGVGARLDLALAFSERSSRPLVSLLCMLGCAQDVANANSGRSTPLLKSSCVNLAQKFQRSLMPPISDTLNARAHVASVLVRLALKASPLACPRIEVLRCSRVSAMGASSSPLLILWFEAIRTRTNLFVKALVPQVRISISHFSGWKPCLGLGNTLRSSIACSLKTHFSAHLFVRSPI